MTGNIIDKMMNQSAGTESISAEDSAISVMPPSNQLAGTSVDVAPVDVAPVDVAPVDVAPVDVAPALPPTGQIVPQGTSVDVVELTKPAPVLPPTGQIAFHNSIAGNTSFELFSQSSNGNYPNNSYLASLYTDTLTSTPGCSYEHSDSILLDLNNTSSLPNSSDHYTAHTGHAAGETYFPLLTYAELKQQNENLQREVAYLRCELEKCEGLTAVPAPRAELGMFPFFSNCKCVLLLYPRKFLCIFLTLRILVLLKEILSQHAFFWSGTIALSHLKWG
jgi:hypothetical protein